MDIDTNLFIFGFGFCNLALRGSLYLSLRVIKVSSTLGPKLKSIKFKSKWGHFWFILSNGQRGLWISANLDIMRLSQHFLPIFRNYFWHTHFSQLPSFSRQKRGTNNSWEFYLFRNVCERVRGSIPSVWFFFSTHPKP